MGESHPSDSPCCDYTHHPLWSSIEESIKDPCHSPGNHICLATATHDACIHLVSTYFYASQNTLYIRIILFYVLYIVTLQSWHLTALATSIRFLATYVSKYHITISFWSFNNWATLDDFTAQDESLYDAAQKMEYLDMVWQEGLRMYSPAGMWVWNMVHTQLEFLHNSRCY